MITVDTLRADRLGAYGYKRARTPVFDGLAGRGARFDRAYAAAPITLPSHASLLTGRYPQGHGARHNGMRIDSGVPLLTEAFARAGFATGAFMGLSRSIDGSGWRAASRSTAIGCLAPRALS